MGQLLLSVKSMPWKEAEDTAQTYNSKGKVDMATSPKCMVGPEEWTEVVKNGAKASTTHHQQDHQETNSKSTAEG